MRNFIIFFFVLTLYSMIWSIPRMITYQGKLTGIDGVGTNDTVDITFRIYDDELGGTLLWEDAHTDIEVNRGFFDVILGTITALNLGFDTNYWMEIEVDDDTVKPQHIWESKDLEVKL